MTQSGITFYKQALTLFEAENQAIVLLTKLDEKVLIDFECKGVKTKLKPLSTLVFKTEHQNCRPIVKIENQIQTSETNENIFIDFQCNDMKSESTTTCKTEYQSCLPTVKQENQIQTNPLNVKNNNSNKQRS
uniref:Uncharacterized protein n=1 Tax=Trichogramma kaykai TaxID=54128 RepID=A0ABD2WHR0_9HYME